MPNIFTEGASSLGIFAAFKTLSPDFGEGSNSLTRGENTILTIYSLGVAGDKKSESAQSEP